MRRALCLGAVCATVSAIGCGSRDGRVPVYPVQGKVVVRGQPAANARVVFYPTAPVAEEKAPTPAAETDAEGTYRLTTFEAEDGAPEGEYRVTVVWPELAPPNHRGIFEAKDRLTGKFASPEKSTLKATVPKGGGEVAPLELQ